MKRTFEIVYNGEDRFETAPMTKTAAIDMCWDTLIQNDMQDDSYRIGYFENDEYILVAIVSRKRRENGRVSCQISKF